MTIKHCEKGGKHLINKELKFTVQCATRLSQSFHDKIAQCTTTQHHNIGFINCADTGESSHPAASHTARVTDTTMMIKHRVRLTPNQDNPVAARWPALPVPTTLYSHPPGASSLAAGSSLPDKLHRPESQPRVTSAGDNMAAGPGQQAGSGRAMA